MCNLGYVLNDRGRYAAAISLDRETFHLRPEVLGREYQDTLSSMNNYALSLGYAGRY